MENKGIKFNEQGFSGTEFLTIVVVATALIAIVLTIALNLTYQDKYKVMKYNAVLFGYNAGMSMVGNHQGKMYLQTMIEKQLFIQIKNPFAGSKYCDPYASFVEFEGSIKYVTLSCGDYVIEHQDMLSEVIPIYKVSKWTTEKQDSTVVEQQLQYNYHLKDNKQEKLPQYYAEDVFLLRFNQLEKTSYHSIEEIPGTYHVLKREVYRTKKLIQQLNND